MNQNLRYGVKWDWRQNENKEHLYLALQQMFPTSADEKVAEMKSVVTEKYHKYKREYAKHLSFNPDKENLSECILTWRCIVMYAYF